MKNSAWIAVQIFMIIKGVHEKQEYIACANTTNPAIKLPEETNSGSSYSIKSDHIPDWRFEWFGEDSDDGYEISTTELQEAINCWLDDIPVRYHTMSTMDFQEIISAWLTPLENYCYDNCEYGWAPSEWTELEINVLNDNVYISNCFKWNDDHMKAFKDLDSYYQYEIRRDKDEEFELKVIDSDNLKANEWYFVYANLVSSQPYNVYKYAINTPYNSTL
jgi:hypothetical protein